jgi:hypothetical protein
VTVGAVRRRGSTATLRAPGEALAWLGGVVLTVSAFTGWYGGVVDGLRVSIIGWNSGAMGKLVVLVGLCALALLALRAFGVELPPRFPSGVAIAVLGALAAIFVLVRLLQIPDDYAEFGRSLGIWISLAGAILLIAAGLLKASEEL